MRIKAIHAKTVSIASEICYTLNELGLLLPFMDIERTKISEHVSVHL
jgi:hypothetical protein